MKIFAVAAVLVLSIGALALVVLQELILPQLQANRTAIAPVEWSILLPEDSFRAYKALERSPEDMTLWDMAENSTVAELDGQTLALSGFMVPLDNQRETTRSFLLVPYQGACIHTPPPPSNQIVSVYSDEDAKRFHNWQPVTVTGEMTVAKDSTELADAGYVMTLKNIQPYRAPEEEIFNTAEGAHDSPLLN